MTDTFDQLFRRFRPGRFSQALDPSWSPQERLIGGDVIENYGFIEDGSIDTAQIAPDAITQTEIADDSISTPKLKANAVTAAKIETNLVLAGKIMTASSGARTEMIGGASGGITNYDSSNEPTVIIPVNGDPVYVKGQITASGPLVTEDTTTIGGDVTVSPAVTMTLQSGVVAPTSVPVLSQGWESGPALAAGSSYSTGFWGLEYTASGGAGGATKVFYVIMQKVSDSHYYILEFLASDGTLNRTLDLGTSEAYGVAYLSGSLYVVFLGGTAGNVVVKKYSATALTLTTTYSTVTAPYNNTAPPAIAADTATSNLYIIQASATNPKFNKYDSSMVQVGGTTTTGFTNTDIYDLKAGNFDFGAFRLVAASQGFTSGSRIQTCNSSGTVQSDESFSDGLNLGHYIAYGDADGTGARFWSALSETASTLTLAKHSTWTWTTASSTYWVGYAWYDITGTTHETALGPRASITMGRRKRLQVVNASLPTGTDVDRVRIYMKPNATEPAAGTYWLQVTDALTSRYITDYTSSGTNDGSGTAFPAGTAAQIASASTGWTLKANGLITFGSTAFPTGPATGDQFFRTDLDLWFFYDGTRWLSTQVFILPSGIYGTSATYATSITATASSVHRIGLHNPYALDWYIEKVVVNHFIGAGTALGASHKWVATVNKLHSDNTATSLGTIAFDSGASSTWRVGSLTVNAVIDPDTYPNIRIDWAKTGTPGDLNITSPSLAYCRFTAT